MSDDWFGLSSMLDGAVAGVLGESGETKKEPKGVEISSAKTKAPKFQESLSDVSETYDSYMEEAAESETPDSNSTTVPKLNKKFRQSFLEAHDGFAKTWRTDLTNDHSRQVARVNLTEAISAVRSTLTPIKQIGPNFGTGLKWGGGDLSPDGRIFFAPHGADHVLCMNPFEGTIEAFGEPLNASSTNLLNKMETVLQTDRKFSCAVVGPKGEFLYLVPASSRHVFKVNLALGTSVPIGNDFGGLDWKWGHGVLHGTKIYCSPHNSNRILMIDTVTDETVLVGDDLGSLSAKYGAPVVVPYDDTIHGSKIKDLDVYGVVILFPPLSARFILALNLVTTQTCTVGEDMGKLHFKYNGACVGADGAMYAAPSCATQMLRVQLITTSLTPQVEPIQEEGEEGEEEEEVTEKGRTQSLGRKSIGTSSNRKKSLIPTSKGDKVQAILGISLDETGNEVKEVQDHSDSTSKPKLTAFISPFAPRLKKVVQNAMPARISKHESALFKTKYVWPPNVHVTFLGAERVGQFKYGSTVLSADGRTAIGIPLNANTFISVDTASVTKNEHRLVLRMGHSLPHKTLRYGGGVVGLDGYLYCSPLCAEQMLRLDTLLLSPKQQQPDPRSSRLSSAHSFLARVSRNSTRERPVRISTARISAARERLPSTLLDQTSEPSLEDRFSPVLSWQKTSESIFSAYMHKQQSLQQRKDDPSDEEEDTPALQLSATKIMSAISAGVHWRKWAAARAREKHGVSASDRVVGDNDSFMKSMMLHEPEVWCYGLTLENSSIPNDLSDWLCYLATTEEGDDFIDTCGVDASDESALRVATVPNLVFSLISLERHALFMRLPIIRKAIVKPICFCGNWLVRCLADKRLMEGAVEFFELVSMDMDASEVEKHVGMSNLDESYESTVKSSSFEQIASIDHLVSPMLKLPHRLQDRIASTTLMAGILDELFTERPLALLIIWFDFIIIVSLLSLLIRATWQVQHEGDLNTDEYLVIAALLLFNAIYITREAINMKALHKLGLSVGLTKTLDMLLMSALFAIVAMSFFEKVRLSSPFLVVASITSGLCWMKLLGFLSGIHLQFAVYLEALKLITSALKIYILMFFIILAMFANMYYVVLKPTGFNGESVDDMNDPYEAGFNTSQAAFLTLFRMLLGDFEIDWYRREGRELLTAFALLLFITYMILVFIIMMNVLIAVVCDNYSFAMSKAHEIFLRSRLQTVANLDMQGFTRLRNTVKHSRQSMIGTQFKIMEQQNSSVRVLSSTSSSINDHIDHASNSVHQFEMGESFLDYLDHFLKDSLWHRYMRSMLGIQRQTAEYKRTIGRLKEEEANATPVVKPSHELKKSELIDYFEEKMEEMREQQIFSENQIIEVLEQKMEDQMEAFKMALLDMNKNKTK